MTREDRVAIHKKQEFTQIKDGEPLVSELSEGVFTVRSTDEGVVQYIRFNGALYKIVLEKADE